MFLNITIDQLRSLIAYLCSVHDIGKAHPAFADQKCCEAAAGFFENHPDLRYPVIVTGYRHELGSKWILKRIWKENNVFGSKAIRHLTSVISLHHQGKSGTSPCIFTDSEASFPKASEWIRCQNEIESEMRAEFQPPFIRNEDFTKIDAICMSILGIIILSDWIASSEVFKNTDGSETKADLNKIARDYIHMIGMDDMLDIKGKSFSDIWPFMTDENLRPLQKALQDYLSKKEEMPVMLLLEAPPGEGKTEAGIYAMIQMLRYWRKTGFYDALPTAGTANQMIDRINAMLEENGFPKAKLLHSTAWLRTQSKVINVNPDADKWFSSSRKGLLAGSAVGTVDQAMMAVLRTKYGVLRLTGLENKVLIIDEIHSYDAYMSTIIDRLLEWCMAMQIPVIMLSATLPIVKKKKLLELYKTTGSGDIKVINAYPLITAAYRNGAIEQVPVNGSHQKQNYTISTAPYLSDLEKIAKLALSKIEKGGNICVIMNTVMEARAVYNATKTLCRKKRDNLMKTLFHARYSAERRDEIESLCVKLYRPKSNVRPEQSVIISTQVLEQSIDVDFDYMISAIAPYDLLIQRAGREARNEGTKRPIGYKEPELIVLTSADNRSYGPSECIYFKPLLDRTRNALDNIRRMSVPADIPKLVNQVYSDEIDPEEQQDFMEMLFNEQLQHGQAEQAELKAPEEKTFGLAVNTEFYDDDENTFISSATRIGSPSMRMAVLPQTLFDKAQSENDKGKVSIETARKIMKYSFSISYKEAGRAWDELNDDKKLIGNGKLIGIHLVKADQKNGSAADTLSASTDNYRIICDKEYGAQVLAKEEE